MPSIGRRLLTLVALALPATSFASPSFFTPQVEQCDGSFAVGATRQAIPAVREQMQNASAPGLKTGVQPSDFYATLLYGARFEDNYRVDVSSCMTAGLPAACGGNAACAIANYRYADTSSANSADQGLLGTYYTVNDDTNFNFDWRVRIQQIDGPINFTKGPNFPPAVIASTPAFTVRWSGFVVPPVSANYTFQIANLDDGVRLYVNGVNLIDSFIGHGGATLTAPAVPMTAGQPYQVVIEYFENGTGGASLDFQWQSSVAGSAGGCTVGTSQGDVPAACMKPQLVGTLGQCVYDGTGCGALALDATPSHNPAGLSCPAFGALPVAPPAGPTPWATSVIGTPPGNASPWSAFNRAWTFNGTSDFIQFDGQGQWDLPVSFTVSAWVKMPVGGCSGVNRILSQQNGPQWWLFRVNGCKLDVQDSREGGAFPGQQGAAMANDGNWHFLAAARQNGAFWKYYIDGVNVFSNASISTTTFQIDSTNAATPAYIGSYNGSGGEFFHGAIDELRLYPGVLSDDTILMEYATNAYKYSSNNGATFGISTTAYFGGTPSNGTTGVVTLQASTSTATSQYIFVGQSADGLTTLESPAYAVTIDKTAPASPLITAQPVATNQIKWSFSSSRVCSDGVSNLYQLYEASTNVHIGDTAIGSAVFTETLSDTSPNVEHARFGKTVDTWGTSVLGTVTTAYTEAAAPSGLSAAGATPTSISLQWNTNGNPTYTRYELSMSQNNFASPPDVSTPITVSANFTGNTWSLTGLSPGTAYYFRVRAVNGRSSDGFGGIFTSYSFFSTFTTPNGSIVTGVPRSNTQIDWHWADVRGATSYSLFSAGAATPFATVPSPGNPGADVFYSSTGLLTNTLYSLQLESVNAGGAGPPSPASSAYTLALPPTVMNVTGVSTNSASFSWDAGAVGPLADPSYTFYEVSVATDALFAVVVATQTTQQLSMTVGGLLPSSTYYARVRAYSGNQSTTTFQPPLYPAVQLSTVTNPNPDVSLSSGPPSVYAPPGGVIGLWQFDEGTSTTAKDSSGYGDNATLTCLNSACVSTPTWISGPPNLNYAVSLPGQTSSLVLINDPGTFAITGALTVAAWVNPTTTAQPNGAAIVAKGVQGAEAFALDVFGSRYRFLLKEPGSLSVTAPSAIDTGHWHRVVGTYDGANAILYIDGSKVAGPIAVGGPRAAPLCGGVNCPVVIGNRVSGTGAYDLGFSGGVDSAMILGRALSASEVASDYAGAFASTITLPAPNNRVQLILPPNAFGAPTVIYASNDPIGHPIKIDNLTMTAGLLNPPAGQALIGGSLIEIVPTVGGVPFTLPLGSSATIALPYNDSGNTGIVDGSNPPISVNTLAVYTLDPTVIKWNRLPSTVDQTNHVVRATTPHFSVFALFGATTIGSALDQVRVYPKPWIIGSNGRFDAPSLTFDTLPAHGKIKIFNLAGERVVELSFTSNDAGKVQWAGTNVNGLPVASGVYFAYIHNTDNNATSIVKFAIER